MMRIRRILAYTVMILPLISCSSNEDLSVDDMSQLVNLVDTRIGTQVWAGPTNLSTPEEPMGFVYPGVGLPNAMVQLSPQTARTDRCYFSSHPRIQGFRASHYPNGAAMSEYGSFTFMPSIGPLRVKAEERSSAYSNDREIARPYYYAVDLDDYGIKAELTGMSRSGMLRFTFPESQDSHIVIDNARSEYENYYRVIPERNEIEGYVTNAGRVGNQGYTGREFACYYVARFSKPFSSYAIVPEPVFGDSRQLFPEGFSLQFYNNDAFEGRPAAISHTDEVDFAWDGSPAPGVAADHFSVRCSGLFKARKSGKHVFYLITDDYSRLSLNGKTVIDTRKTHRPFPDMYTIDLQKGDSLEVLAEYVEKTRLASLRLCCVEPEERSENQLSAMAEKGSTGSALTLSFATRENERVEIRVGTSFLDFNQARKSLADEIGSKSFEAVAREAKDAWEKEIGRITVETSQENKRIFYTAMQRIACTPRDLTEDGYHYSAFNGKIVPGIMYTDYSIWDTFRALHPLMLILTPDKASDMITALLNAYDEGGWMPKWPSPGYSNIMVGTHADAIIADAYVKGLRTFDTDKALEAMIKDATTPGTGQYQARVGILDYIDKGFVPTDRYKESVMRTVEFAYDDFCVAQLAKGMGRDDLYQEMMTRSMNYRNVMDASSRMIRGRNADGSWRPEFDQAVSTWAQGSSRDCETYYRNISLFAPHDVPGLIEVMGGKEAFEAQLDYFFDNDFYYVGDEFSMHSPYLYNYVGAPWKTQKLIRRLIKDNFTDGLGGLPGNEDCGQLSAWYIFNSIGFYPVCPGSPEYQIGSPSFDKVTMNLPGGKSFTVIAENNSAENVYVQSVKFNGRPYDKTTILHEDIMKGGTLVFEMGPEPNKGWGLDAGPSAVSTQVAGLSCDYLTDPLGIDNTRPMFGWKVQGALAGDCQTHCRILVSSSLEKLQEDCGDLWDSGKLRTSEQIALKYAGKPLESGAVAYWKAKIWTKKEGETEWSSPARFSIGLLNASDWKADFICHDSVSDCPLFWKRFKIEKDSGTYLLHVNSLAYHEVYLNGEKLGDAVLQPAVCQADKRSLICTYDVGPMLKEGDNDLVVWLAEGWNRAYENRLCEKAALRLQLQRADLSGSVLDILSTDCSWKARESGWHVSGTWKPFNFGGDIADANVMLKDFSSAELDSAEWADAVTAVVKPHVASPQMTEPCRVVRRFTPVSVRRLGGESWLVDFGTCLTGNVELAFPQLKKGKRVIMDYADCLGDDGTFPLVRRGDFKDVFISAGREKESFAGKFNYHGFRYLRIDGLSEAPVSATACLLHTDYGGKSSFHSSDGELNAIHDMVQYTVECLTPGGYMVDCPHVERLGYGGDGNASTPTLQTMFKTPAMIYNWSQAWADAQMEDGGMPHTAPAPYGAGGGPFWCGFPIVAAWQNYLRYGDDRLIVRYYPVFKKWMEFVASNSRDGMLQRWPDEPIRRNYYLGDWAAPEKVNVADSSTVKLVTNCFMVECYEIMGKISAYNREDRLAAQYHKSAQDLRKTLHERFYSDSLHGYATGSQIDLCYPMLAGVTPADVLPEVEASLKQVVDTLYGGNLATGLVGVPVVTAWATESRNAELMYSMLKRHTYPGYLYMLNNGATTTWEYWNGYRSHIHNCFNGIGSWFYEALGGILPDEDAPGFRHFTIAPQIVDAVSHVRVTVETPFGTVLSEWKKHGNSVTVHVSVPFGTKASLVLPGESQTRELGCGDHSYLKELPLH